MKLAFSTLGCPDWTLEQCVAAAREYGYDGIELRLLDGAKIEPGIGASARSRVRSVLDAAGLLLVCLDTSVRIAQPDPEARAAQIRDGLAMIDLAAEWRAPLVRVFGEPPPETSEQDAIASATATLLPLAERAHDLGIAVVLETHDAFCSSAAVMQTLAGIPAAGAGVLWDLLHPYRIDEDPADTLSRIGARLRHVHIKDGRAPAGGGTNWNFVLLGEGTVPTREILGMLQQAGYNRWLSVEWEKKWHPELAAPEVALPQHVALLRQYLAELAGQ
jgi:sugar phosphate isomerase/epimerase